MCCGSTEADQRNETSLNTGQNIESPKIWTRLKSVPRLAMADRATCNSPCLAYLCPSTYATAYCGTNRTSTSRGTTTARHAMPTVVNTRRKEGKYQKGM